MTDFVPTSGVPVTKLAVIAKLTGQNVGQIDDHVKFLGIDELDIDVNPIRVADRVADLINELDAMMGQF